MPILPSPPLPPALSYRVSDLIADALIEVGSLSPGETLKQDEGQWAFRKLNYLLDTWAARKNFVYSTDFKAYTLVPNLSPHTIGPQNATYTVAQRPVKIISASVILNNVTPNIDVPLNIRDDQWWAEQALKTLTTSQPTDLFYSADFPNGSLYFWPTPTTAYGVRLETWALLSQFVAITDPIGGPGAAKIVPPGYRNAMMLTLAETLLPGVEKQPNPVLVAAASAARLAVFGNNTQVPRMSTADSGIPNADRSLRSTTFNYRSRSY